MSKRHAMLPTHPELGIAEIDSQHAQLFNLLDELTACCGRPYSAAKVKDSLIRMFQASGLHFAMEESMMRLLGYPEVDRHAAEHSELSKQFLRIQNNLIDPTIAENLPAVIEAWLINHIDTADRDFVGHFHNAGVLATGA